jgi:EmrB/QacA subfamily drug resistance transporter
MSVYEAPTLSPATGPPEAGRKLDPALLVIAAAQFLIVMDATVVTVGLPSIGSALHMQPSDLSWVVTGYALAFGGLLLTGGRTGDLLGARRTYRAGLLLLVVASSAGGLAVSGAVLIAARIGQGVAAAFIAPAALSLLATTYPAGPARTTAMGVYGAMSGLGPVAGLLLGGALTEYVDWRWILLVNIPVALVILVGTSVLVESDRARGRLDLPGGLTATLGVGALVYAVSQAPVAGWTSPTVVIIGAAAFVLLVAFLVIQSRSSNPTVPVAVVADRGRAGAYLVMFLLGAGMLATYYFLSMYMQQVNGYPPLLTGLAYLPMAIATVLGSGALAPKLLERLSVRAVTVLGLGMAAASMLWFAQLGADQNPWVVLIPAQVVSGVGVGLGFVTLTIAGVRGVAGHHTGTASSMINTATQIGGALGLAVLVTIATTATAGQPTGTPLADALASGYVTSFLGSGVLFLAALLVAVRTLDPATHNNADNPPSSNGTKGTDMSVARTHHYTIDPADLDELLARRATLIATVRKSHPGLTETRLIQLADGTYTDIWRWDSAEQMQGALAATPTIPEARAAMSLTRDLTALNGEIIDER